MIRKTNINAYIADAEQLESLAFAAADCSETVAGSLVEASAAEHTLAPADSTQAVINQMWTTQYSAFEHLAIPTSSCCRNGLVTRRDLGRPLLVIHLYIPLLRTAYSTLAAVQVLAASLAVPSGNAYDAASDARTGGNPRRKSASIHMEYL